MEVLYSHLSLLVLDVRSYLVEQQFDYFRLFAGESERLFAGEMQKCVTSLLVHVGGDVAFQ